MKKILLIEDDELFRASLVLTLEQEGFEVAALGTAEEGLKHFRSFEPDLVVSDIYLPDRTGIDCSEAFHREDPHLPIILMTGMSSTDVAIRAMQAGAFDFVVKPFKNDQILELIRKGLKIGTMRKVKIEVGADTARNGGGRRLIGSSRPMQEIYKQIGIVADKPVTTLIHGETGTGKELVARAIYHYGSRAHHTFLAVNCGAIPPTLLESELFGHERGAFTGAQARRIGRFEQARHGTLFLDEIGDLQPETQIKLLRVLQEKVISRIGSNENIPVETRVIAATHVDLEAAVREGRFRQDLYYRLSQAEIRIPPLRERCGDIPELIEYFMGQLTDSLGYSDLSISEDSVKVLQQQEWPGNVRELENVLRKAALYSIGQTITRECIEACLYKDMTPGPGPDHPSDVTEWIRGIIRDHAVEEDPKIHARIMRMVEEIMMREMMKAMNGNRVKVAQALGISRPTVYRILEQMEAETASQAAQRINTGCQQH